MCGRRAPGGVLNEITSRRRSAPHFRLHSRSQVPRRPCTPTKVASASLPGLYGSLAAAPQVPGWAIRFVDVYNPVSASGSAAAAREVTINRLNTTANVNVNLNLGLKAEPNLVLANPTYVFATPVLGGQIRGQRRGHLWSQHCRPQRHTDRFGGRPRRNTAGQRSVRATASAISTRRRHCAGTAA